MMAAVAAVVAVTFKAEVAAGEKCKLFLVKLGTRCTC